jgi:hypothetical protein
MHKRTLAVVSLLVLATVGAFAQTQGETLVIQKGDLKTVRSKGLSDVSVQNVLVSYIHSLKGDEATVVASAVGETVLELTHRGGQKKKIIIRVVDNSSSENRAASSPTSAQTQRSVPPLQPAPKTSSEGQSAAAPLNRKTMVIAAPIVTTVSDAATVKGVKTEAPPAAAESSSPSWTRRLQFSVETSFTFDRERLPLLSINGEHGEETHEDHEHPRQEDTITAQRSLLEIPLSLRFALSHRNTVTLRLPFIRRRDDFKLGGRSFKFSNEGLGDVQIGFERTFPGVREGWDGFLGVNAQLPTGESIYDTEENESPLGAGHYQFSTITGVRRVFDPVFFNAAVGANYTLPRQLEGTRVRPGIGYSLQTGVGFSMNDRWVFSEQLSYSQQPNVFLVNPNETQIEKIAQSYLSHSLFYNTKSSRRALRFMLNLGLNNAASDYTLSLTYFR